MTINEKKIHFVVCSITFLQLYLPLVQEGNRRGLISCFYLRKNSKEYANPLNTKNYVLIEKWACFYGIRLFTFNPHQFNQIKGIVFFVDGDVYGPRQECVDESVLRYVTDDMFKVSLTESMNYRWSYEKYISDMDRVIFLNRHFAEQYSKVSPKNVYLGSPKYDFPRDPSFICQKYSLDINAKYVVVFYPKRQFWEKEIFTSDHLLRLYDILRKLGYQVLVKTRDKDPVKNPRLQGDRYFSEGTMYPSTSLELLTVSQLAIVFSSSTVEEAIMCQTPVLDLVVDHNLERLEFLYTTPVVDKITYWQDTSFFEFRQKINSLIRRSTPGIFYGVCLKYLQNSDWVSPKILDYVLSQHTLSDTTPTITTDTEKRLIAFNSKNAFFCNYFPRWRQCFQYFKNYQPIQSKSLVQFFGHLETVETKKPWIGLVHNYQQLECLGDTHMCQGLFFLHQWDYQQALKHQIVNRGSLDPSKCLVLPVPYPLMETTNTDHIWECRDRLTFISLGHKHRRFDRWLRLVQRIDTQAVMTPWTSNCQKDWMKKTGYPSPPAPIKTLPALESEKFKQLLLEGGVLVCDLEIPKINDTMILAIEWGIPIIINKQDLTLEVFGADYPLFMDRVLGEVQLRDRILEAHRYLYGRKSKLMINGEKWGFQLSSSRLVKRLLFPTLF